MNEKRNTSQLTELNNLNLQLQAIKNQYNEAVAREEENSLQHKQKSENLNKEIKTLMSAKDALAQKIMEDEHR